MIRCTFLMLAFMSPAAFAQGEKDKPKDKPEPKPEEKLVVIARFAGTLQSNGETGAMKVRVPIRRIEANVQAQQNLIQQQPQWLRRQAEIMRNPNPVERYQQMVQLARDVQNAQKDLFVLKETHIDVDLETNDDFKVRTAIPNPGFDDMGNLRKLTPEILKELRGKENLPGFIAERSDLKNGQTLLVVAARDRTNKDPAAKPLAALVVILAEPTK